MKMVKLMNDLKNNGEINVIRKQYEQYKQWVVTAWYGKAMNCQQYDGKNSKHRKREVIDRVSVQI